MLQQDGRLALQVDVTATPRHDNGATAASQAEGGPAYRFLFVDQTAYERHPPGTFTSLTAAFRDYQT
jgi:hypothetical protein